jgi:hypothetical protein
MRWPPALIPTRRPRCDDDGKFFQPVECETRAQQRDSYGTDSERASCSAQCGREEEQMTSTRGARYAALGAAVMLFAGRAGAAVIEVGSAMGSPGQDVTVSVTLRTEGELVIGTQNRLSFDRETPIAALDGDPDCTVNPAIEKEGTGFRFLPLNCDPQVDCQSVRVFVLSLGSLDPIPDNSVLYTCRIAIAAGASAGPHVLTNLEFAASGLNGHALETTGSHGSVEVLEEPVASIDIGTASGPAGSTASFAVSLSLLGDAPPAVAGVQNDVGFDPLTPVAATLAGEPDCTVNPAIDKDATTFAFLPMGCAPGSCSGIRAFVLSTGNSDPLADGVELYSCNVAIAEAADLGSYALVAGMPVASAADSSMLPAIASDGSVEVVEAPPVCVGDCDADGMVAINELLIGVNIVTGGAVLSACEVLDVDEDGTVAINEIIQAVGNALSGCFVEG